MLYLGEHGEVARFEEDIPSIFKSGKQFQCLFESVLHLNGRLRIWW